ncbi:pre-mRNA-splicing factor 38B-like [Pollicipes pollicipes]|uniref:pre-mRNA-splicing factor 38B-like n=1 Tax=Pollicipes pollicipes TaxID=41117 RepID=UPI001885781A|nr:pre-mRNA-splicing factor 38B-like [Pollicipes pollicipes]
MIDVRAGGGEEMTVGVMVRKMLVKLDWYGTLFPRIPVPIQMKVQKLLKERFPAIGGPQAGETPVARPVTPAERPSPRERSPGRDQNRAPQARDIAEEIAMEKERIRRERDPDMGAFQCWVRIRHPNVREDVD